jgi:conjugal transfer pilus assembly protein TraF
MDRSIENRDRAAAHPIVPATAEPAGGATGAVPCARLWLVAAATMLQASISAAQDGPAPTDQAMPAEAAASAPDDTPYWRRSREGWFWQKDPPPVRKPIPPKTRPPAQPAPGPAEVSPDERDLAALADFRLRMERALNVATINPTEANVMRYLELHAEARRKASVLADVGSAVALRMPWIDGTTSGSRPVQPTAQRAFDAIKLQDRDQLLRELTQTHGLYFFFRSNCAYCHVQGPMLRQFQEKYGFTVFAVSLDGGQLPEYPNAVRDNGLAQKVADAMGVPSQHFVVPAIVLAKPSTKEVIPVGFGAMTMDEMADRVAMVVRVRDGGAGRATRQTVAALMGEGLEPDAGRSGEPSAASESHAQGLQPAIGAGATAPRR